MGRFIYVAIFGAFGIVCIVCAVFALLFLFGLWPALIIGVLAWCGLVSELKDEWRAYPEMMKRAASVTN